MQTCYFRRKDTNSFSYLQIFQRKKQSEYYLRLEAEAEADGEGVAFG